MIKIRMVDEVGDFAENKEIAKQLREKIILPALSEGEEITIDFEGVDGVTQSFVHALISDVIRQYRETAFDNLFFAGANADVRKIISIVYRYMQESLAE